MSPFRYHRPGNPADALGALEAGNALVLAGGTNLVDLMKEGVMRPHVLVDVARLALREIGADATGRLHLGALATNAETANHARVREHAPLLRTAILAGASPQIRNRATNGGNLLQRTRCAYFHDVGVPCNKRQPGSGCPAATGITRMHAILGASEHCGATHPSDMCVALSALDAVVHVASKQRGAREIPFADFHRLPGDRPERDTTLEDDELITHLTIPPNGFAQRSCYLKLRERASYAFALVSVAAAFELGADGLISGARIALGGVAHKPWRDPQAEQLLVGRQPTVANFREAAQLLLRQARSWGGAGVPESLPGNQFKIPLAEATIVRALELAHQGVHTNTGEDFFRMLGEQSASFETEETR
jgi:xanthine dehydrogenase YagS FAD-binding subunit